MKLLGFWDFLVCRKLDQCDLGSLGHGPHELRSALKVGPMLGCICQRFENRNTDSIAAMQEFNISELIGHAKAMTRAEFPVS